MFAVLQQFKVYSLIDHSRAGGLGLEGSGFGFGAYGLELESVGLGFMGWALGLWVWDVWLGPWA